MLNNDLSIYRKPKLLFVGAFPSVRKKVVGGNVVDCRCLIEAGLPQKVDLILLDSTQRSVPPPSFSIRLADALARCLNFLVLVVHHRPDNILIFCSAGASFLEKSLMAALGRALGHYVLLFPRGGRLMDDARRHSSYARLVKCLALIPNLLLCQGQAWQRFFNNEMGVPLEKCIVLKSWTATSPLLQIGAQRKYKEDTGGLRLLFLGWLKRTKGIFELIDAFARLHKRFPHLRLDIAGEGNASREARRRVYTLGLSKLVNFLGWVEGDRKLAVLAAATIFCLPSHFEGLPNAMIEAMAAGLPVIVTPVGAIPDVVSHRCNGLITPIGNSTALEAYIEELIMNPILRQQLGRAAHETADREFSPETAVDQLLTMLRQ